MHKLFVFSHLRTLKRLGTTPSSSESLLEVLAKNNIANSQQSVLYRLPREELKHVVNLPCPINSLEQPSALGIISASKQLRYHASINQEKTCRKCPFKNECSQAMQPFTRQIQHPFHSLLVYFHALHNYLKPDGVYYRQWVSGYRLGDSIIACIDDLSTGGKQIQEYQRLRLESIKNHEQAVLKNEKKTTNDTKKSSFIPQISQNSQKKIQNNKPKTSSQSEFVFDEQIFQPKETTPKISLNKTKKIQINDEDQPEPFEKRQSKNNREKEGKNFKEGQKNQRYGNFQQQKFVKYEQKQNKNYQQNKKPYENKRNQSFAQEDSQDDFDAYKGKRGSKEKGFGKNRNRDQQSQEEDFNQFKNNRGSYDRGFDRGEKKNYNNFQRGSQDKYSSYKSDKRNDYKSQRGGYEKKFNRNFNNEDEYRPKIRPIRQKKSDFNERKPYQNDKYDQRGQKQFARRGQNDRYDGENKRFRQDNDRFRGQNQRVQRYQKKQPKVNPFVQKINADDQSPTRPKQSYNPKPQTNARDFDTARILNVQPISPQDGLRTPPPNEEQRSSQPGRRIIRRRSQ